MDLTFAGSSLPRDGAAVTCPHCDLIAAMYRDIRSELETVNQKLEKIMSEDAAVQAVVADENTQIANLTTAVASMQSLIQALTTEVSSGTALQPGTLASLQQAQAALDALAASAEADVTAGSPQPAATATPSAETS